jgi:hypothetical protein
MAGTESIWGTLKRRWSAIARQSTVMACNYVVDCPRHERSAFIWGTLKRRWSAVSRQSLVVVVCSYVIDCPRHDRVNIHLGHFEEEVVCNSQTEEWSAAT